MHTHMHTHTRTVAVVTGLQIAIAVLGGFRKSRLNQYVGCLEASLQAVVDQDMNVDGLTLPENVTYPVSTWTFSCNTTPSTVLHTF